MKKKLMLLSLVLASSLYAETIVEEDFYEGVVVKLEESIVSGEGFENDLRNTPKSISVVTSEDIKKSGARNIIEALRLVPSVKVTQGSSNAGAIDIRGQGKQYSRNTSILVDGIKVNSIEMTSFNLNSIPIETIERIEIIPSNAAVLYGDNTVGGAVNIITKKGDMESHVSIGSEYGSYETYKGSVGFSTSVDKVKFFGNYIKKTSDGYRDNQSSEYDDVTLGSTYQINDSNTVSLKYDYHTDELESPSSLTEDQVNEDRTQASSDSCSENESNRFVLGYNYKKDNLEITNDIDFYKKHYESTSYIGKGTENLSDSLKFKYILGKNKTIIGLDYFKGETDTKGSTWNASESWATKDSIGGFISNTYSITDKIDINGGIRNQYTKFDYSSDSDEKEYNNTLYEMSLNYKYSDTGSAFISHGTDFRTPLTNELLASNGYLNESLKPEEGINYEIGIKDYVYDTLITTSIFYKEIEDAIYLDVDDKSGGTWGTNTNYDGNSRKSGVELALEKDLTKKLNVSTSYSYLDSEFLDGEYEGNEIPGVSNHQFAVGANYKINPKLLVNLTFNYVGESFAISDEDNEKEKVDSYATVDFNISYDVTPSLNIYGGIKNLTNTLYYESVQELTWGRKYYPASERNFYTGFNYTF